MSEITLIPGRQDAGQNAALYERLLGAIGTEDFGATVRDSVMSLIRGVRRVYLFEATGREESSLQYYFGEPGLVDLFPDYLKWYLRQDPVCDAYHAAPNFSDMALQRVRPPHIVSPAFRRRIFEDAGIVERLSVVQRGPQAWRVINISRHASEGCFTDAEIDALVGFSSTLLPMISINRSRQDRPTHLSVAELEERFADRFDCLTLRERQVCARAAIGMSVEATAQDLGIAKSSVLTYRRRAYLRLSVTSPYKLCALVTH